MWIVIFTVIQISGDDKVNDVDENADDGQHQEKNGLLLWKRCVNEKNRFDDVLDLKWCR